MINRDRRPKLTHEQFTGLLWALERLEKVAAERGEHVSVMECQKLHEALKPTKKRCGNCFKVKPLGDFYANRRTGEAQHRCKECNSYICKTYASRMNEAAARARRKLEKVQRSRS